MIRFYQPNLFPAYSAESSVKLPQTACKYRRQAVYEVVAAVVRRMPEMTCIRSALCSAIRCGHGLRAASEVGSPKVASDVVG
jgi:hypothetical protein